MRRTNVSVIVFAVIAVVAGMFLCTGCDDGGVESGGGDAVAYLEQFRGKAVLYGESGTFTDKRDRTKYKWVTIVGPETWNTQQTWMAENLNYETGNSRCYDDAPKNCAKYGRLYNWETAQTVCPTGWKLPSKWDFDMLVNNLGSLDVAGGKLKAKSGWKRSYSSDKDGNGSDDFGFNALPGGHFGFSADSDDYRDWGNKFTGINYSAYWWMADEEDSHFGQMWLFGEAQNLLAGWHGLDVTEIIDMNSVRCLRDDG